MPLDIDHLKTWIGRCEEKTDTVTSAPLAGLLATLDYDEPSPDKGMHLPPAGHWLYFLPNTRQSEIDADGHPQRGGFLPPVDLPRRMWAGGRIEFLAPIRVGETIKRVSTIKDVSYRQGKSGDLVFVVVQHDILGADGLAVREEHDIVYRRAASPGAPLPAVVPAPLENSWTRTITPDPVLLFRYSALTFNGHRIHYDRTYATEVEGYPGLIVHGPLMATLLMDMAARENPGAVLRQFSYRALSPVFDTAPFTVNGKMNDGDLTAKLWIANDQGNLAMTADAEFSRN